MGFDPEPLIGYFASRAKPDAGGTRSDYERYLQSVETAVGFIDQFHVGGH